MNGPSFPGAVGVIGGGRMGAGIAHAFLLAGADVTILEQDADAATSALTRLHDAVRTSVDRGSSSETEEMLVRRAAVATRVERLRHCDLVIEAVPEVPALKLDILKRVESELATDAWLCSNTSSISIDLLASSLARPERFCGLHFFNPVPSSSLIEIVPGERTNPELIEHARDWANQVGKTAIVVGNSPGFASSRLGIIVAIEAMRMLEEGVATASDIDTAMVLGYRHPVGPLRLTDMVGLDVRLGIAEYLASELGERFEPPGILRDKVAAGKLGRKTGEGFFTWST
ncbi:MAG: 3-hydroxyacyl-CoA dehydrogenase family protein [Glaciihabitans sp.]|nr:3-hydroxyacyl-CoA dehydrogenase family protein [Glaciihabitans sp.]MDQ1571874.1 3-hydroxybutyryl-CoA dehydrogenase [Actinomycetota bacterium]